MAKISTGHALAKACLVIALSIALGFVLSFGSGSISKAAKDIAPSINTVLSLPHTETEILNSTDDVPEAPIEVANRCL